MKKGAGKMTVDEIYLWAWETAVPGETSTETMKRAILKAMRQGSRAEKSA